jgi:hypothetical protein
MVLRNQIARIARLHSLLDIVLTSLQIDVNETIEISELAGRKPSPLGTGKYGL